MLYNKDQKLRYLQYCKDNTIYTDSTIETIKIYLAASYRIELRLNKDVSEFTQPEIIDLLKSLNAKSRSYPTIMCSYFSKYYEWCRSESLVVNVINNYDSVWTKKIIEEIIPIEAMINKYFTKNDMFKYIDKIKDVSNKFMAYCLFLGIKSEELIYIKINDLNEGSKTLQLITGRTIKVDNLFIDLMKRTNSADHYFADVNISYEGKEYYYEYLKTEYVLKPVKRNSSMAPLTEMMLISRIRIIKAQTENKFLSVSTLYKNGLINYIVDKYSNYGVTLEKALFKKINRKLYTFDEQTEEYINEFGSKITPRMLRYELKDYVDVFK